MKNFDEALFNTIADLKVQRFYKEKELEKKKRQLENYAPNDADVESLKKLYYELLEIDEKLSSALSQLRRRKK